MKKKFTKAHFYKRLKAQQNRKQLILAIQNITPVATDFMLGLEALARYAQQLKEKLEYMVEHKAPPPQACEHVVAAHSSKVPHTLKPSTCDSFSIKWHL